MKVCSTLRRNAQKPASVPVARPVTRPLPPTPLLDSLRALNAEPFIGAIDANTDSPIFKLGLRALVPNRPVPKAAYQMAGAQRARLLIEMELLLAARGSRLDRVKFKLHQQGYYVLASSHLQTDVVITTGEEAIGRIPETLRDKIVFTWAELVTMKEKLGRPVDVDALRLIYATKKTFGGRVVSDHEEESYAKH